MIERPMPCIADTLDVRRLIHVRTSCAALKDASVSRPVRARQAALEAARRIVRRQGASHLTYEELARESGITRGGITYHFPTKEDLLRALVEADLKAWDVASVEQAPLRADASPEIEGHVRCSLGAHATGVGDLVAGLLSAASTDPVLLGIVREHEQRRFSDWVWDDAGLLRYLALLAAEGAFWRSYFQLPPSDGAVDERLHALIERLLAQSRGAPTCKK
jgi:AcrR family transcriptional regulator